jgi:hypothetical protein
LAKLSATAACSSARVTKRSTDRNIDVTRGPETSSVNQSPKEVEWVIARSIVGRF